MRKSEQTRLSIMQTSAQLIYVKGYQSTSIDDILSSMQVTKGAFFYHFKNKEEMALAFIKELMYPGMRMMMVEPLLNSKDPIKTISKQLKDILNNKVHFDMRYGCPMINLIEEMSPLSEAFSNSLKMMTLTWVNAISDCLKRGQANGQLRPDVNTLEVANYMVTGYAGARNMGKIFGIKSYQSFLKQFSFYMESLR
ncbi:TetR/AcrR family transcriptional regulator [Pedobacter sp. L105]|uniref:TetR/AcrR family transcriptional regulator n=1 Tax=Pedobacter sp. L105 TaxID=1641871 RepID=UPI00131AEB4A|nr:TetR/AcrR family transcriptional regulator [Pedobacter sp. L105]